METIKHNNGSEVTVQYFGNLRQKLAVASGYIQGVNAYNNLLNQQDGMLRPMVDPNAAEAVITKQHNKFYGLDNKYDGKGNLRG